MVNTKKSEYRKLRFASGHDVIAEAERIVAAERAGTLRRTGNWSVGQNFGHLATWIEYAMDGYPPSVSPPPLVRFAMKFLKGRFMKGPLPRGIKISNLPGGTLGQEEMATADALERLRRAWTRLMATPPTVPNPLFGPMTHEEWIKSHLRHAELHLGYLHP